MHGRSIDADGVARPPIIGIALDGTHNTMEIRDTDGGSFDGDTVYDRAVGPMQFIPETWRRYGRDGSGDGVADPQNIDDAALTAAGYLCAGGRDLSTDDGWIAAIRAYNPTIAYNHQVAEAARRYASAVRSNQASSPVAAGVATVSTGSGVNWTSASRSEKSGV